MGHPNDDILGRYFPGEPAAILDRKEAMFRDALAASVEPLPGIHALLDWAEANGVGTAVVTNAPRRNALAMLAAAGLAHRLPTLDHRRGMRAAEARPRPLPGRDGRRSAPPPPARSPSRTAAPAFAPPAPPGRMSSA